MVDIDKEIFKRSRASIPLLRLFRFADVKLFSRKSLDQSILNLKATDVTLVENDSDCTIKVGIRLRYSKFKTIETSNSDTLSTVAIVQLPL